MNRGAVAGVAADVRSGSKGDIVGPFGYVRFAADSGLDSDLAAGPLSADFVVKVGRLLMSGGFLGFRSTLIHALEAVRRAVEGRLGRTRVGDWWRSSDQLCQAP